MDKIRVGMIGAGQIAYTHCREILAHPQAALLAVADPHAGRARALQENFKLPRACADYGELLAEPGLDAVSIAVPNYLHAEVAIAALRAGKHVFLDKPFALNLEQARSIRDAAARAGRQLMIGMDHRFSRQAQTVHASVKRGDLGRIYHARVEWFRRRGAPKLGTWFTRKDQAGGGCLYDIGVHMLDLGLFLMDNWQPVSLQSAIFSNFVSRGLGEGTWGMSDRENRSADVEDFGTALIRFADGASMQFAVAWAIHQAEPERYNVELFGTEGGSEVRTAKIYRPGRGAGDYVAEDPQDLPLAHPQCNRFYQWIDVLLGQDQPVCTTEQALVVQALLDGMYRSAASGREVRWEKNGI